MPAWISPYCWYKVIAPVYVAGAVYWPVERVYPGGRREPVAYCREDSSSIGQRSRTARSVAGALNEARLMPIRIGQEVPSE